MEPEEESNVIETCFGHGSEISLCNYCDSPVAGICRDGTIICLECQEPRDECWFFPHPSEVS